MTAVARLTSVVVASWTLLAPCALAAQSVTSGTIAGIVRDTTGAVLPGVTVEAASPALIEKVRSVVTDDQGNYKIIDLRPGTYSVTFTLPGFSVHKREGIELTTGFTANASAELKVGSLEETVTVTGASPVVDVQNVRQQNVITRDVLDTIPTARGNIALGALTLGARGGVDVGGTSATNAQSISIHGTHPTDLQYQLDGMGYNISSLAGGVGYYYVLNYVGVQEVTLQTDGFSAESNTIGVQSNAVPKDGGNRFSFFGSAQYADENMASNNVTPALKARNVPQQPGTRQVYDYGVGVGGPIKRDRLWFYSANRWNASYRYSVGGYLNASPNPLFFVPGQPSYAGQPIHDNGIRLTWQVSARHKITASENYQDQTFRSFGYGDPAPTGTLATATPTSENRWGPLHVAQFAWTYPRTNKLLFDAGQSTGYFTRDSNPGPYVKPNAFSVLDQAIGLQYGAGTDYWTHRAAHNINARGAMSYVTGSHAVKLGVQFQQGIQNDGSRVFNDMSYTFRGTTPIALTEFAPLAWLIRSHTYGMYAQDQWSRRRLTLNYGVRVDHLYGYTLAQDAPVGRFVPARRYEAVTGAPNWWDVSPRLGAAYDLFGTGKTAVKGSVAQAVTMTQGGGFLLLSGLHPARSSVTSASRTWTDGNGNYSPDCDLLSLASNGECGPLTQTAFGTVVRTFNYEPGFLEGFGKRQYNWRYSAVLQHELRPGIGLTVGYFGTQYGNFTATENRAVTPADFSPYCVTAPADPRLPGGGGNSICGFYDVSAARLGQTNNVGGLAKGFNMSQRFDGADVSVSARLPRRAMFQGGVSTGRFTYDACSALDKPNVTLFVMDTNGSAATGARNLPGFCAVTTPWSSQTQFKIFGSSPLIWGIEASANFQNLPGAQNSANLSLTGAQLAQALTSTLGRAGTSPTYSIPLIKPFSMFEARMSQLDVRFTKVLKIANARVKGMVDIYNAFNANTVLGTNATFGAAWLRPTSILAPRLFKVGAEVTF